MYDFLQGLGILMMPRHAVGYDPQNFPNSHWLGL